MKPTPAESLIQDSNAFNPPTGPRALQSSQSSYNGLREQADRERRQNRRAEPQVQDGSYGFSDGGNPRYNNRRANGYYNGRGGSRAFSSNGGDTGHEEKGEEKGLYSDEMMIDAPAQGSRNKGRGYR